MSIPKNPIGLIRPLAIFDVTLNTEYPIISPNIARDKIFYNKILYYSFKSPKNEIRVDLDYKVLNLAALTNFMKIF